MEAHFVLVWKGLGVGKLVKVVEALRVLVQVVAEGLEVKLVMEVLEELVVVVVQLVALLVLELGVVQ